MNGNFKDIRLIEAFELIDPKYIAEVGESLKLRSVYSKDREYKKPPFSFHVKQIIALVGCLILLSAAFPVVNYAVKVINSFAAGWGSGTETLEVPETTNGMYDEYILTEDDLTQINEAYWQFQIADMIEDGFEPSDEDIERMKNSKYSKYALTVEEAMRRNTEDRFYFGKYGDCFIFGIIPNPGWGGIHFPIYELGEYRISIEGNIRVAYEHEWISLSDAYDRGLLSDEDAAKLYEVCCKYFNYNKQ